MASPRLPFQVVYLAAGEAQALQQTSSGGILGMIGFGATPQNIGSDRPLAWVDAPVLDSDHALEVWSGDDVAACARHGDIRSARCKDLLFGCLSMPQAAGEALDATALRAYAQLLEFVDDAGFTHLLRIWNYFPAINEDENGLERYRRFCVGRHEAFEKHGRRISEQAPAACALGSRGGPVVIVFLAATAPGVPVENPRQVSAYDYPAQYGPRSPSFARALVAHCDGQRILFVSGTASIVGHESVHVGDIGGQMEETLVNLRAVMDNAEQQTGCKTQTMRKLLRVYLRHAADYQAVRTRLLREFGTDTDIAYVQADICRRELLLEIEAVCIET